MIFLEQDQPLVSLSLSLKRECEGDFLFLSLLPTSQCSFLYTTLFFASQKSVETTDDTAFFYMVQ